MHHVRRALMLVTLTIVSAGCASDPTSEAVETTTVRSKTSVGVESENHRRIVLTNGDELSVKVGVEGDVKITVTIAAGKPDAGSYVSTSPGLWEAATAASNALTDPNTAAAVTVDKSGTIISISVETTL